MTYWKNLLYAITNSTPPSEVHYPQLSSSAPIVHPSDVTIAGTNIKSSMNGHQESFIKSQPSMNAHQPFHSYAGQSHGMATENDQPSMNAHQQTFYPYAGQPANPPMEIRTGYYIKFLARSQWETELIRSLSIYGKIYGIENNFYLILNPQYQVENYVQEIINYVNIQTQ